MNAAHDTLLSLRQKLNNERIALIRKIEGIDLAIEALGFKAPVKTEPRQTGSGKISSARRSAVIKKTGHTITFLIKEGLREATEGMSLRDIGTYLARRGVDPVVPGTVSGVLSTLKQMGAVERTEDGEGWRLTKTATPTTEVA